MSAAGLLSGIPLAIGPTGKRTLNSRMIDRFRSDSPDLPKPYLPVVDILTTYFPAIKPPPLTELSEADRNKLLDALRKRVKNYDESVRARLNTGQLTLRTNSFSSNRSLHLKELIGELLGVGLDGVNAWLGTGVRPTVATVATVAPPPSNVALPPLALDEQVRNMFRALSFAVAGPSGEQAWETFQTEPPPSLLLDPVANAGLDPLQRLRYVYWGLMLRKDLPPIAANAGASAGAGATASRPTPSLTPIHTLPEVLALGERLGTTLRPVLNRVSDRYSVGNPSFDIINPYVQALPSPVDPSGLIDAIKHYNTSDIEQVLSSIVKTGDLDAEVNKFKTGTPPILKDDDKKRYGKQAASLLVTLLLKKMLAPKVDVRGE